MTICVNNGVGSALSLTFPALLERITPTGAFGESTRRRDTDKTR